MCKGQEEFILATCAWFWAGRHGDHWVGGGQGRGRGVGGGDQGHGRDEFTEFEGSPARCNQRSGTYPLFPCIIRTKK